jgi:hypothetical protein
VGDRLGMVDWKTVFKLIVFRDMIARFHTLPETGGLLPKAFFDDFVRIAAEEAKVCICGSLLF